MHRQVRTSKTGGPIRKSSGGKRWSVSAGAHGFGMGGNLKISSKRKHGVGVTRAVAPSANSTTVSQYKPRVSGGTASNSFTIENRELLSSAEWSGSNSFELTEYSVNPGLSSIFGYASNVSKNYTRYAMNMRLIWAPSVPSTVQGQIAFAMDRDNTATPPSSMQEFLSYESNVVTSLWKNVNFPTSGMFASSEKLLYIRFGPLDDLSQINLYDLMKVYVAFNGVSTGTNAPQSLGSLYIEYKITFFNQKLQDIIENNVFSVTSRLNDDDLAPVDILDSDQFAYQYAYGEGDTQVSKKIVGGSYANGVNVIFPSAGYYKIDIIVDVYQSSGTAADAIESAIASPFVAVGTDVIPGDASTSPYPYLQQEFGAWMLIAPGQDISQFRQSFIIRVLASGSYLGEDNLPIGQGWVTFVPTNILDSINTNVNVGTSVWRMGNSYMAVNRISPSTASFYYPVAFPPTAAEPQALLRHRRQFHPVKTHLRSRRCPESLSTHKVKQVPLLEVVDREVQTVQSEPTYEDYMLWKKTQKS